MGRWRCSVLFVLVTLLLVPPPAPAQEIPLGQSTLIGYWPATVSFAGPGGTVTWSSTTLAFSYDARSLSSPYGFRLRYAASRQASWSFSGGSGQDAIWSVDVTVGGPFARAFAGYGSTTWENTDTGGVTLIESTTGVRVGADIILPLAPGWSVHAGGVWTPAARTTITAPAISSTDEAAGSVLEYGVSLRYEPGSWFVDVGYRGLSTRYGTLSGGAFAGGCPCSTAWRGFTLGFGARF